jgi:acetyl esterase/lipase
MAFDSHPAPARANFPGGDAYAAEVLERSRRAAAARGLHYHPDICYDDATGCRLDLYAPARAPADLPCLIFVHGGAFSLGCKEWMGFMAPTVTATPALFISVSYRLAPGHVYPAAVRDVAAAVDWAWRNVGAYRGDPARLFLGGHSAGGHLASLVALDRRWLDERGLPARVIKGALPISGLYDLDYDGGDAMGAAALAIRRRFIPDDSHVPAASPMRHVGPLAPPFYLGAGEHDLGRLAAEALAMRDLLRQAGVPAAAEIYPDHDHYAASSRCVDDGHPWITRARAFLRSGSPI